MRTIAVILVCGIAGTASAQPTDEPPPSPATVLFEAGRTLLDFGQPGPACDKFEAALKLEPGALGTLLNLGLCNEQRDRLATALRWFRRAQVRASELQKADTEAAAKEKTSTLATTVPTLAIAFTHPAPAGTIVTIDAVKIDEVDYTRVEVDAGTHLVESTGPKPSRDEIVVADGETKTVTISIAVPEPPPVKKLVTIDRGPEHRRNAYILGGVGAGLLIGDTALCLVGRSKFNATDMPDTRDHWKNIVRYGGTSIFVVGSAAIAGAVWLYVTAPGKEQIEQTVVAPAIDRDHVGVAVSGTF